jgi:hypothetical protein
MSGIVLSCMLAAAVLFVGTPVFAKNARLPHDDAWPIYDWHDHQPTQDQLSALHLRDVTRNQARGLDRLYNPARIKQFQNPQTGTRTCTLTCAS